MEGRTRFTQVIRMKTSKIDDFLRLRREYDADRASAEVMGFLGARVLASREHPGEYLVIAASYSGSRPLPSLGSVSV